MSILPRETGGGIFGQGAFQVDPNATPDQIAMKRQLMAAMMPRYGEAKYIGQGIGQALTGLAHGRMNRNLDKAEGAGRKSATDRFYEALRGGGTALPDGFSILGAAPQPAPVDPASPQGIANDTMAALGKGPTFDTSGVSPDALAAWNGLSAKWGQPLTVTSAYRDPSHNAKVGGAKGSQHMHGNAFDVDVSRYSEQERLKLIAEAKASGFKGVGIYNNSLHFDVGPERAWGADYTRNSLPGWAAGAVGGGQGAVAQPAQQPVRSSGAPLEALYAAAADPWLDQGQRAVIMQMIQQRQQESDPLRQMQLQKGQLELEQMRNPPAPEELTTRRALAAEAGLQPGTPEYQTYMATGKLAGGADLPSGFATLDLQAKAAGYQPGTPEYQEFMRNGGGSGAPAAFISLDMQANAAGFEDGTPEYKQFMATRGSGLSAQASAEGKALGEATASAPTQIANGEIALQGIEEIRKHEGIDRGTGMTSMGNWVPGTKGYAFQTRVQQLAGGAFLTAIQQMQGMGALSNAEGQTATAALARLNTGLSRKEFEDALADYEAIVKKGMERAQAKLAPAAQPQSGATMRYNPATGKIEPVGGN